MQRLTHPAALPASAVGTLHQGHCGARDSGDLCPGRARARARCLDLAQHARPSQELHQLGVHAWAESSLTPSCMARRPQISALSLSLTESAEPAAQWRLAPSPARARWLDLSQRDWLQQRQEAEKAATRGLKGDGDSGSASQLPSRWAGVRTDLRAIAGAAL